jgi:hypothetical protein
MADEAKKERSSTEILAELKAVRPETIEAYQRAKLLAERANKAREDYVAILERDDTLEAEFGAAIKREIGGTGARWHIGTVFEAKLPDNK